MTTEQPPNTRVDLLFAPEAWARMEELQVGSGLASPAQLIRRSLSIYDYLVQQAQNGFRIEAVSETGEVIHPPAL